MKLRVRLGKRTEKVEVSGEDSIGSLKERISTCFNVPVGSFELSLNGKDAISETNDSQISTLGLVSGDLVKLITDAGSSNLASRQSCSPGDQSEMMSSTVQVVQKNETAANVKDQQECHPSSSTQPPHIGPMEEDGEGSKVVKGQDNEPMFIRDSREDRIPLRLREIWETNRPKSADEALSLVLHVMMLETGFILHSDQKASGSSGNLPSTWRESGCCRFSYIHQQCDQSHVCHMACVPLGSILAITGIVSDDQSSSFSLQLRSVEYVKEWKQGLSLRNTAKLSRIFKDTIAHPITHRMRENSGLAPLYGLLALAVEIQMKIMTYLDVRSILNLSEVCHSLYDLSQDETLWRHLCLRDSKASRRRENTQSSWKNTYKRIYLEEKERERAEEEWRRQARDHWRHPHFVPTYPGQFPGPAFPGIRGGDYDLDPFSSNPLHPGMPRPNPLHPQGMRPRRDPIFPDADLDPQPGPGRGLQDGTRRGLREGPPGGRIGFRGGGGGSMGFFM